MPLDNSRCSVHFLKL